MKKDWKIVKIPEVLSFQEGPGVRKHQFTSEGVKLLNVGNINDGQINLNKTKIYISEKEAYGKYKHFLVDDGDLVIASSGIVVSNFHNKIAFISKEHLPLCMNTSTIRFKVINKKIIDINYFKYFLKTNFFTNQLQRLITGSAQLNFGPSHLKKIDLVLPPIEDQKRIVKILDEADVLRQKRKQAMVLLDEYLKSVFLEMFDKENTAWSTLKEISNFIDYRGKTPVKTNQGIQLITAKNVKEGYLDFQPEEFIAEDNYLSWMRRGFPKEGDILFTTEAPLGNTAILPKFDKLAFAQRIIVIQPKEMIKPEFLLFALNSTLVRNDISRRSTGSTVKGIRSKELVKVKIPVPELKKQEKFVLIFNSKLQLKQKMVAQTEELETQFQALMQKAFKGKL